MRLLRDTAGKLPIKMIIIIVLALGVALGGMAVMKGKKSGGKKPEKKVEMSAWKLDEFIVNLADKAEPRYLKVVMVLEVEGKVPGSKAGEGEGESKGGSPEDAKVRDGIIEVLTQKTFGELLTDNGKTKLKAQLISELNKSLKGDEAKEGIKVHSIYFTSFAMQ